MNQRTLFEMLSPGKSNRNSQIMIDDDEEDDNASNANTMASPFFATSQRTPPSTTLAPKRKSSPFILSPPLGEQFGALSPSNSSENAQAHFGAKKDAATLTPAQVDRMERKRLEALEKRRLAAEKKKLRARNDDDELVQRKLEFLPAASNERRAPADIGQVKRGAKREQVDIDVDVNVDAKGRDLRDEQVDERGGKRHQAAALMDRGWRVTQAPTFSAAPSSMAAAEATRRRMMKRSKVVDGEFVSSSSSSSSSKKKDVRWAWLVDRRDAQKRRPGEPDYDPTTLHVPYEALKAMTMTQRQYWEFKKDHMDCVVFMQIGSFYEFFEDDALLGQRLFGMKLRERTNMMTVGFPMGAYDEWAAKFVARGYKVVRFDQRDTSAAAAAPLDRQRKDKIQAQKGGGGHRAEARAVTEVLTAGTLVNSLLLGDQANYLLSYVDDAQLGRIGICMLDASIGQFRIGEFRDDEQRTHLETVLLQSRPKEFVVQRGRTSARSRALVRRFASGNSLQQATVEPVDAAAVAQAIDDRHYFDESSSSSTSSTAPAAWPPVLARARSCSPLAMSALGACLGYIRSFDESMMSDCRLDFDLMSQNNFASYSVHDQRETMLLDGQTLVNLEVLENNSDHGVRGTLLAQLDHCVSAGGRRLLRQWICHPLRSVDALNARLDAIDDLERFADLDAELAAHLRKLPDLQRLVTRVHAGNVSLRNLLDVIDGCLTLHEMMASIDEGGRLDEVRSPLLRALLTVGDQFPDLGGVLKIAEGIDRDRSRADNVLTVQPGSDAEYDEARDAVRAVEAQLDKHLRALRRSTGDEKANYAYNKREGRTVALRNSAAKASRLPDDFRVVRKLASATRYSDATIGRLGPLLDDANERLALVQAGLLRRFIARLDRCSVSCRQGAAVASQLDALRSLARASQALGADACRPKFESAAARGKAFVELENARHPMLVPPNGQDVIANTVRLGGVGQPSIMLLTGPNMGGKSTLLRQTCVCVIMAQIGCRVPASSCTLAPFDRIFTRVGANDNITAGQSTFMVELKETSTILRHATAHSLVVFDELGRGTSTWDGYSIAHAVLEHFSSAAPCCLMFSTHYHSIVDEFRQNIQVDLQHMACYADNDDISFLYSLQPGVATDSYAMDVARMAGLPAPLIDYARQKSQEAIERQRIVHQRKQHQHNIFERFRHAYSRR
jgi:DNA mismatch repair protein MSH6